MSKLLRLIRCLLPWLGESRAVFELKNQADVYSKSFKEDGLKAKMTFEVSSQGEFQQVVHLIKSLLNSGQLVELIYASESLEKDIETFKSEYSVDQLRVLRLPILNISLLRRNYQNLNYWITGESFIFVRYDFYPHLISAVWSKKMKKVLVWGSLKNKMKSGFSKWFWTQLANFFDVVYSANQLSAEIFQKLNPNLVHETSEMRIFAIQNRLDHVSTKFKEKEIDLFAKNIKNHQGRKLILGSAYLDDLDILNMDIKDALIVIAPHSLNEENIESFHQKLIQQFGDHYQKVNSDHDLKVEGESKQVFLFTGKGVLCELYTLFHCAFVGGGFQKSIHSVLEPFWAGCSVACGPLTHRSTEIEYCLEVDKTRMKEFSSHSEVSQWIVEQINLELDNGGGNRDNQQNYLKLKNILESEKASMQRLIGIIGS